MSTKRQRFSDDFKQQIVELYQNGTSVEQMIREYGISKATIYKWIDRLKPIGSMEDGTPINKKEVDAMRKRMRELEMENEILKKATAIFARKP